jgi:hypothetical protein
MYIYISNPQPSGHKLRGEGGVLKESHKEREEEEKK